MRNAIEEPRTIAEAYSVAISADDLTVKLDTRGTADLLIAAATISDPLAHALMRTRAEFDQVAIPRRERFPEGTAGQIAYESAVRDAMRAVKTFRRARELLLEVLDEAEQEPRNAILATRLLMWWLRSTCDACEGRGYLVLEGTKRLSDKACGHCHGSGKAEIPGGRKGRAVVAYLESCADIANRQMLHSLRDIGELPRDYRAARPKPGRPGAP